MSENAKWYVIHTYSGYENAVKAAIVQYHVGDTVRITDGPLSSFTGTVEEIEPEKNRVRVVVSMFSRETTVDLELDQVEVQS